MSSNVIDEVSDEALVGIEVKGSDLKTYTYFDGNFVFGNLKSGECKRIASYTSYNKNEKNYQIKSKSNLVKIELYSFQNLLSEES